MPIKNWFKRKLWHKTEGKEKTRRAVSQVNFNRTLSMATIEAIEVLNPLLNSTSDHIHTIDNANKSPFLDDKEMSSISSFKLPNLQIENVDSSVTIHAPSILIRVKNSQDSEPTEKNPCEPQICTKKCFTCGPPACEREEEEVQELRKRDLNFSMSKKSVRWNKANFAEDLLLDTRVLDVKSDSAINIQAGNRENNLIATPITDHPITNLKLSEALAILMKQGIVEPHDSDEERVIKGPSGRLWSSSSEEDNAGFVSRDLTHRELRAVAAKRFKAKAKSDMLLTKTALLVDACVNTSLTNIADLKEKQDVVYKDSLVQLKRRSQLNEGSCTQFFALRSFLQLEPYLQDLRHHKHDNKPDLPYLPILPIASRSSNNVERKRGMLTLSKGSFADDIPKTGDEGEGSIATYLPKVIQEEKVLAVIDMSSDTPLLKNNAATSVTHTEDLSIDFATAKPPLESCARCRGYKTPKVRTISFTDITKVNKMDSSNSIDAENISTSLDNNSNKSENITFPSYNSPMRQLSELELRKNDSHASLLLDDPENIIERSSNFAPSHDELILMFHTLIPSKKLLEYTSSSYAHVDMNSFMFKWNFLKTADSFAFSLGEGSKACKLNHVKAYEFNISPGIYIYLQRCSMPIELFVISMLDETLIGKCSIKLGRCFADTTKIYESNLEINNDDLCLCFPKLEHMQFGHLVCRYRIRGNQNRFDECKPEKATSTYIPPLIEYPDGRNPMSTNFGSSGTTKHDRYSRGGYAQLPFNERVNSIVSEAELQAFQDGLNLVLVRNKALRTTQEEITNELKDRTTWMHEELKWRLTLQENAILCGKDPGLVKWRQWKDETTANVRYRPISHEEFFKDGLAHIEIEILELLLNGDSKAMNDDSVTHIYIEFSFLNYSGKEMETSSIRKPIEERPIRFKYKKVFDISIDDEKAYLLSELIKNNECIPFTVISQPLEDMKELHCCTDIGVANLVLFTLMQSRQNTTIETMPLMDCYKKDLNIGSLKVKFTGVLAMRSMALHILTPDTFRIIR